MRETGAAPQDTVVIGDTVFDLEMARAAGAHAIGVAWGYHPPSALREVGAHAMIESFAELLPTLDRLWGGGAVERAGDAPRVQGLHG
jgi:phosphoglycolate phosphatase